MSFNYPRYSENYCTSMYIYIIHVSMYFIDIFIKKNFFICYLLKLTGLIWMLYGYKLLSIYYMCVFFFSFIVAFLSESPEILEPFFIGCDTKNTKIVQMCLTSIQRLITQEAVSAVSYSTFKTFAVYNCIWNSNC